MNKEETVMAKYIDTDEAWDEGTLQDWYLNSIDNTEPPIWTEEHISKLCNDFIVIHKEAPAADVAPVRHGAWLPLETTNGKHGKDVFKCSECRTFHFSTEFCPKCGALMDADKKDVGTHEDAIGYAPNGDWCGECLKSSCINCSVWREKNAKT